MPVFNTVQQAQTWCSAHFPAGDFSVSQVPASSWSLPTMHFDWFRWGIDIAIIAIVYCAGRYGIPALWADLKSVYSGIRNLFGGSKTSAAPAPAATQPVATPVA